MPISVPQAVRYTNPLASLPDPWAVTNPPEGPRLIPCEIVWTTQAGANKAVDINFTGGGTGSPNDFSRCAALSIDNSKCGATVRFVFLDTTDTITIPAYSPKVIVPVFSGAKNFFVMADGQVLSGDVTRFQIHNTVPPPIAVPTSQEQSIASVIGVNVTGSVLTQVIAAGISGTLENGIAQLTSTINGTAFSTTGYVMKDGDGKILGQWTWGMNGEADIPENAIAWQATNVHLRFNNGVAIQQSVIYGAMDVNQVYLNCSLYYRAP